MSDTYTNPQNLVKPEPGGSRNTWGTKINDNLDALNRVLTQHDQALARKLDIAGTPAMTGSITFQNNGTGLVFSSGGKIFDTGAALVVFASQDTFRVFNEAGTLELLSVTPSVIKYAGSEVLTRANFNSDDFLSTSGGKVNGNVEIAGSLTLQNTVIHSKAGNTYKRTYAAGTDDSFDTVSKIFSWQIDNNQVMYATKDGDFTATGKVTQLSDGRVKTNVVTLEDGLSTALKLRPVRYTRTDTAVEEIGVIAQEVEALLPECVVTSPEGVKAVSYGNLVAVTLSAIRDLNAKIEALEARHGGACPCCR